MTLIRDIRDIATHTATKRAPRIAFQSVAPAGRTLARPPLFLLGPAPEAVLYDLAAQTETPEIGCYTLQDAQVAPTGIPIKHKVAFHSDAFLHPRHLAVAISDRLNAAPPPTRVIPGTVATICGPAHETYGHWLVDFLPRLWVLAQAGHDLDTLRFLVPADLTPIGFTLLQHCGIASDQLILYDHWHELPRVETLILPTGLRSGDRLAPCFAAATAFWIDRIRHHTPVPPTNTAGAPLYLARTKGARRMLNRDRIESIAEDQGFTLIRAESLSIPAQIALFSGASVIAGEYGSALHNSVFAPPGTAICALRGTTRDPSLVQSGIATALSQNTGYVFGRTEGVGATQTFHVEEHLATLALALVRMREEGRPGALPPGPPLGTRPQAP
jgi:capsular polysaccharide biosynthesis protein